jgi:1-deoxy-D-xylulose-5-phosphate synthase
MYYIGPINGNDYATVEKALTEAKRLGGCTVVHLFTKKGKGYEEAEKNPDGFHSVSPTAQGEKSLHAVFSDELINIAKNDESVVAITAAMGIGTGLTAFEKEYPDRYYDVGIAEEHALTFSAGLAAAGMKPYVAIYSTFLQRSYDNILHDVALQNLPVRMIIDRAGLALSDGATHHGIFDVSFLMHIPSVELYAPVTYGSLCKTLEISRECCGPIAIRYANTPQIKAIKSKFYANEDYSNTVVKADFEVGCAPENVFITYGNITEKVIEAQGILSRNGIDCGIILCERLKPLPISAISELVSGVKRIVFVEEGILNGGFSMICEREINKTVNAKTDIAAIDDNFANPSKKCDLYEHVGLSAEKIANRMISLIK